MVVREFDYSSKGEVKSRKVLVVHQDPGSFAGIDLNLLTEQEADEVKEALKDLEPHPKPPKGSEKGQIENFKPEWFKAWRQFKESSIVEKEEE